MRPRSPSSGPAGSNGSVRLVLLPGADTKPGDRRNAAELETSEEVVALAEAREATVEALARALELHDYRRGRFAETVAHGKRVSELGLRFAQRVSPELAADERLAHGFRLHDIGMIGVSDSILARWGNLAPADLDEFREHPLLGERIVATIGFLQGPPRQVIGAHHERWDGSGYPRGLEGARIPLAARIFALADAFETMTEEKLHREALPAEIALKEIERRSGVFYDPALTEAFLELVGEG